MNIRHYTLMIFTLAFVSIAACAPRSTSNPTPEPSPEVADETEVITMEATDTSGDEPINIGAMFSITGGFSSIDTPGLNGMLLAAHEINAAGGLLGRPIEVISIDGESESGGARQFVLSDVLKRKS